MTNVRIYVTYRESVFDPQGDTIKQAIHALGHDEVADVKVGKFFDVQLDSTKKDISTAVKEIAEELLVNFNLETYEYKVMEEV